MTSDFRCTGDVNVECGHMLQAQHGPDGCMANGCACKVQHFVEGAGPGEAVIAVAVAAREQFEAFQEEDFTREEAFALTKELLLISGRGLG